MSDKTAAVLFNFAGGLFLMAAAISARDGGPINYAFLGIGLALAAVGIAKLRKITRR